MRDLWYFILLLIIGASGLNFNYSPHPTHPQNISSSSISSRSLAITSDGTILCVVNPDSDSLTLIDTNTHAVLNEIPVGNNPRTVAVAGNTAYVTNHGSDSISLIDVLTRDRIAELKIAPVVGVLDQAVAGALEHLEGADNLQARVHQFRRR